MAMPAPKPKALLADKGYDGDDLRAKLLMTNILPIIPPKAATGCRDCIEVQGIRLRRVTFFAGTKKGTKERPFRS